MADRQYHLKFDGNKAAAVDAYLEYKRYPKGWCYGLQYWDNGGLRTRIVGDDDGGQLFTPEQYEAYKKEKLPMRLKNRLFTSWTNSSGMDCKLIGPETNCFCQHRYKQHKTDFATIPQERPILLPCKARGCKCISYHYVPLMGSQPIRCTCKHFADEHSEIRPYQCKKNICQKCSGFKSSFTCGCGEAYNYHQMIVETKEEREARGHPVGEDTPYAAMGGLTGFSSLAEGYVRLDPSGRGAPSEEFLSQPITSDDHTFLRAHVPSIHADRVAKKKYNELPEDMAERISAARKPGESDMDYFERRYQERLRREKAGGRAIQNPYVSHPDNPSTSGAGGSGMSVRKVPSGTSAKKSAKKP